MNGAIVHTWKGVVPGRETKALDVLGRAIAYYDELAKEGRIYGHAEYFSPAGDPAGLLLVTGDIDRLREIESEDGYMQILAEASLVADGFRAQIMGGGDADTVGQGVTTFVESLQRLGFA